MKIPVTRADVRDFVKKTSGHVPGVLIEAVVSEQNSRLDLVGDHPETTALTAYTVQQWIEIRVFAGVGDDEYDRILRENVG